MMRVSRKIFQRFQLNSDNVFLLMRGERVPNTTKSGPSFACQQNAMSIAFRWQADGGQTLNAGLVAVLFQGIRTSIAKEPCSFAIYPGEGVRTPCPPPSGSAHGMLMFTIPFIIFHQCLAYRVLFNISNFPPFCFITLSRNINLIDS